MQILFEASLFPLFYTTLTDYTSKVRRHIIKELGQKRMAEVTLDDIQVALVPVSKKSVSVYKSVIILYKSIFRAAQESHVIDTNPTIYLNAKGGGIPQEDKQALTDEQAERLLDAIQGLPPYVFVMIGLYAGLRREEILALQWDSVYLDTEAPYLTVRRAWHGTTPQEVMQDREGLATLRTLGHNMAYFLKCKEVGSKLVPLPPEEPWEMTNFIR